MLQISGQVVQQGLSAVNTRRDFLTQLKDKRTNKKDQMIDLEKLKATFQQTDLTSKPKPDLVHKEVIPEEDPLANPDANSDSEDSEFVAPKRNNVANWDDEENSIKI
jgi:hypothetical protein